MNKSIRYIGVNDKIIDLFEGQYSVPHGMSYNSYVIFDEKIAVMDTVDKKLVGEWLAKLESELDGRAPDYLIVHHMEPDHSAGIAEFVKRYPEATVVASAKAHTMMTQFFGQDFVPKKMAVKEGDELSLGNNALTFIAAPMVHWPEVILSYEKTSGTLFSADAFGRFGALDEEDGGIDEMRRYYIGIVGKYGAQVTALLKKAAALDIKAIYPLHGPLLTENIAEYIRLYSLWASYTPEEKGITIAYTSVYGNTRAAAQKLEGMLREAGATVAIYDLARCDISEAVASAFRYDTLVLATTTYNADVFPHMKEYINHLTERGFSRRRVALIENGSWAPMAAKVMKAMLEGSKELNFAETQIKITSAPSEANEAELKQLANELIG
jgi:flavorubredoxin